MSGTNLPELDWFCTRLSISSTNVSTIPCCSVIANSFCNDGSYSNCKLSTNDKSEYDLSGQMVTFGISAGF